MTISGVRSIGIYIYISYKFIKVKYTVPNWFVIFIKIVSQYDQEIPQYKPQTTPWHREEEPLNHHETPGRQIKQGNQLTLPHQNDCNTTMDIK